MEETDDLKLAFETLKAKQKHYASLWTYYDGGHPLIYSASRLREIFQRIDAHFEQNWCAAVVDAVLDRLNLQRLTVANDDAATTRLEELWARTEMYLDADDVHLATLVTGEAFVIVWRDDGEGGEVAEGEPPGRVEAYYNDPLLCHVFYDEDNPRKKRFAAKWWVGSDDKRYLTLYYPDRLEYYASTQKADQVENHKGLFPAETPLAQNPFGTIPVFHFRRERRKIKSELANAVALQDAINKLLADMMVGAEFSAFPQRYIISNMDTSVLKNRPGQMIQIPAGMDGEQVDIGEFSQIDLAVFLDAMDKLATSIAVITRTPKHYFFGQGGDPSGEALIAMEAPLNRKCGRYQARFAATWRRVAAFMLELDGHATEPQAIQAVYEPPETVQPMTQAQVRQTSVASGMPLLTVLRREGWSEADLAQLEQDRRDEAAANQASLANALLDARRRFDQGEGEEQQQ